MPLPDVITIDPLAAACRTAVSVPGSKSITNRVLALAALAEGETVLRGALWSEDTQVMVDCLRRLGCAIAVTADPAERSNRTMRVRGCGGHWRPGGGPDAPLDLFVGNAGTAARFLAALVTLGRGTYRLQGVARMHERPQHSLFEALRALGYRIDTPNGRLPAVIHGTGPRTGGCRVSVAESSQFASALLLGAGAGGWSVTIEGENPEELPYVAMTSRLIAGFPRNGGEVRIEPDASSGSYFWAINALSPVADGASAAPPGKRADLPAGAHRVTVSHWPASGLQMDEAFPRFLPLPAVVSRERDLGDSIMTAIALAPLATRAARFTELGRLRLQECERVRALRTELTKCGAEVREAGDTLEIAPGSLHGADIETYEDHRMAMCFAILALNVPGLRLHNPACVKKTFPNFFQKLADPDGVAAVIRDAADGRRLAGEELMAGEAG
ncbi:MAG: hypothetical protein H7A45_12320 [Verrucomicrobiales bacterium]|nr:hypothetical protein [Verrucomicrobiales bacterium]